MARKQVTAKDFSDPTFLAGGTLAAIARSPNTDRLLQAEVKAATDKVKSGDLSDLEAILVSQAAVLNALFIDLIQKGTATLADRAFLSDPRLQNYPKTVINLALKAQNQSKAAIEAINDLKNPKRTTFIKNQLNQVSLELEELRETVESSNGGKELDAGATAEAIRVDQELAALAIFDRSENTRR